MSKTKTPKSPVKISKIKETYFLNTEITTNKNIHIIQMSVQPKGTSPEILQKAILELKDLAKDFAKYHTKGKDKSVVYIQEDNPFRVLVVSKKWNEKESKTPTYKETY